MKAINEKLIREQIGFDQRMWATFMMTLVLFLVFKGLGDTVNQAWHFYAGVATVAGFSIAAVLHLLLHRMAIYLDHMVDSSDSSIHEYELDKRSACKTWPLIWTNICVIVPVSALSCSSIYQLEWKVALTLFVGLVASISLFAAAPYLANQIWDIDYLKKASRERTKRGW